jgi:hypothetical protein
MSQQAKDLLLQYIPATKVDRKYSRITLIDNLLEEKSVASRTFDWIVQSKVVGYKVWWGKNKLDSLTENTRMSQIMMKLRNDKTNPLTGEQASLLSAQQEILVDRKEVDVKSGPVVTKIKNLFGKKTLKTTLAGLAVFVGMGYGAYSYHNNAMENKDAQITNLQKGNAADIEKAAKTGYTDGIKKANELSGAAEYKKRAEVAEAKNINLLGSQSKSATIQAQQPDAKIATSPDASIGEKDWTRVDKIPVGNLEYLNSSVDNSIKGRVPNKKEVQNNLGNLRGFATGQPLGFSSPEHGLRALKHQILVDQGNIPGVKNKNGITGDFTLFEYVKKYSNNANGDMINNKELRGYIEVVTKVTGKSKDAKIKDINTHKLAEAITIAEGSVFKYNPDKDILEYNKESPLLKTSFTQTARNFLSGKMSQPYYKIEPINSVDFGTNGKITT